jgi:hypothetical protein
MDYEIEEEILEEEYFRSLKKVSKIFFDEDGEEVKIEEKYIVEYTDEIQYMGSREDYFGDEMEFLDYEQAKEFYYDLEEPVEYRGVYNSASFYFENI